MTRSCCRQSLVAMGLLVAGTCSLHAQSQKGPDIGNIKANWRVTNLVENGVWLMDARPEKLFNWAGEPVKGRVTLSNAGATARKLNIAAWLEQDIDIVSGRQEQEVELAPGVTTEVAFEWPAKEVAYYGQTMLVEVTLDDRVIARGGDCFGVASNFWEISIGATHPEGGSSARYTSLESLEPSLERCRDKYLNTFEKFFWAPDDFGNMTPKEEVWYSGQTRYHESKTNIRHLCEYGLKIGVMPTTYGKSLGMGSGARDLILRHPELIRGYGKTMEFAPDTEELAEFDRDSEKPWQPKCGWAFYNMNDPAVVQHGIEEIVNSTKAFGWAAVRFDGHFQARTGKQRVGEAMIDFSSDMADRQTAANQKALKEHALKLFPRYAFGYNYAEYSLAQKMAAGPREAIELCSGGGQIMDEGINMIDSSANPYNRWADFAALLVKEAEIVRRLGGHLAPILNNGEDPMLRYKAIFAFTAGAHPTMCVPWAVKHPYHRFATRYSGLLWHKDLRNVWNPSGLVFAPAGAMWELFVRELDTDASHKRLVVHLVNPPPHESAIGTREALQEIARRAKRRKDIETAAAAKKVAPDTGELDRLSPVKVLPDPQKDVSVRLVPAALRGQWIIKRTVLLDPETGERRELPVDASDPYFAEVKVPELNLWAVLVFDLEGKE